MRSSWLVVVVWVVGCYHGDDPPPTATISNVAPPPASAPPPPPPSQSVVATSVPADLPATCKEYGEAVDKLAACKQLPQASKDALRESIKAMTDSWKDFAKMPAEAKKAAEDACAEARDAVLQAVAVCN